MTELKCKNCGAVLDPHTLKCAYCGSQYVKKEEKGIIHYIQTCPAQITTLGSQVSLSEETLRFAPPEKVAEFTMRELTHSLAEALTPYIKVETMRDPYKMTQIIRGTIRVVEPDFRF